MEHLDNTSKDASVTLDDCNNMHFTPQLHHKLLIKNKIELCPPILITSSSNIDRYIDVCVKKVFCDNILISGVIYTKIKYVSTNKCGSKCYDVVKCYNTPFQTIISSPCNDTSLCNDDYEAHASINSVIYSDFFCFKSLCGSCEIIAWELSEEYLVYITVQKKCKFPVCKDSYISDRT